MKKIPLNRITLKFNSEELERQYRQSIVKQSVKVARTAIILGMVLFPIFGILDIWMVPESIRTVWGIRLCVVILLIVIYVLTFRLVFRKHIYFFLDLLTIIIGAGVISMVLVADFEGGYFYYAGLMLTIQFAHGLIRLRFIHATIVTILIAATYLLVAWGIKSTPGTIIINNSFFLFTTIVIGMFISYALEFYMRGNFWQTKLLSRQENLLKSEYQRKTKELENVRQLQLSILPKEFLKHPTIEIVAYSKTAVEVGGDYYDYHTDDANRISFAIGDATGHGAQAGALVTAAKIMFSSWAENEDVATFVNKSSATIKQLGLPHLFVSMIAGTIVNDKLELAGGGIPAALIHRKDTKLMDEIPLKGFPLGCVAHYSYKKICINLYPGDSLLFMTDGFPELFNENKEMLGYERIKQAFCEVVNETSSEIVNHLNQVVDRWRHNFPLQDDLTFFVIKVKTI